MSLIQFASKVDVVLDEAEKKFYQLFQELDKARVFTVASQEIEGINKPQNKLTSLQDQKANKKVGQMNSNDCIQKNKKQIELGKLINKKQQLMNKLRLVDRQLLQHKFKHSLPSQQKSNKEKKFTLDLNQENIKYKMLEPLNNIDAPTSSNRTLDIMDKFNRQKIRRHEEIIRRMNIRQLNEIRKIQELQERRIKNQLKRNKSVFQIKQNKNSTITTKLMKKIR